MSEFQDSLDDEPLLAAWPEDVGRSAAEPRAAQQPDDTDLSSVSAPYETGPRSFAGLPIATVILGALVLMIGLWSAWQTREILILKSHRTVSVSLSTIVRDFIRAEARNGGTPETAQMRTQAYLGATEAAIRALGEGGNTVLVSEAVAGNSVPDVTPEVKAAIEARLRQVTAVHPQTPPAPGGLGGQ